MNNALSLIKTRLQSALYAIAEAEKDTALFATIANNGDQAAKDMIAESVGKAADAILDCYQEIDKHAQTLKQIV